MTGGGVKAGGEYKKALHVDTVRYLEKEKG